MDLNLKISLDRQLFELNKMALEYARFEPDDPFDYSSLERNSIEKSKYDTYCCMWFNFLSQVFDQEGRDTTDYIYVYEIVKCHEDWWKENRVGYGAKFAYFIDSFCG